MAGVPPPPAGCDEYFSLSNLAGSSYETEVGFSTLCVPNQVKAAVFILGLIFFFGLSGLSVLLMVKEFRRKNQWKWSWRTRGLVVYAVVPFCESFLVSPDHRPVVVSPADLYFPPLSFLIACAIINAMHLGGVQSSFRYLLYFLPPTLILVNTILKIEVWFVTTSSIKNMMMADARTDSIRLIVKNASLFLSVIGLLLLGTILPIVYYDDKFSLNWFYTFFIFYFCLWGTLLLVVLAVLSRVLAWRCDKILQAESKADEELTILSQKVILLSSPPPLPISTKA